jgi:hypothetical protein
MIDFVVEVYAMPWIYGYYFRCIPVGTTVTETKEEPVFVFKGTFKNGFALPLDALVYEYDIIM